MKVLYLPVSKQKEATQAKPTPPNAGCPHGGHEDYSNMRCDACYLQRLKTSDRFGLWAPITPMASATPAQKRQAV